jgi:hypothetical protein
MQIQAAAISLLDKKFVVAAAQMELVQSAGEADMAIEQLQEHFGVPVVLMALAESGSPNYYGDSELVELLRGVPVDEMPWKEYDVPA